MIDSDASKQKKYKDFTLSQATQSLIRQRKTVNLFKTNLLTLISHKLVRMQQRSSMVFEKDNEEDQSLGKLTSQEFNHGDEFINCQFGQKQESTDNTHPLFLKSKLFDAKLIKCKYNQQNSVVVILKNVSYKIRHQRDTEMKNVRNKVFQTITHNLKTPLNGIMTILGTSLAYFAVQDHWWRYAVSELASLPPRAPFAILNSFLAGTNFSGTVWGALRILFRGREELCSGLSAKK